ncbi:MAG: DNA-3-methyladenine glycosylase [Ferruginibacter sp.]
MRKLPTQFYDRINVVSIAEELIGKILVTRFDGIITSGRIVETEAYIGLADRASHSFAGKRTQRNEHMYAGAGTAYVYICYGVHHLFNVITNKKNIPDAVLIRSLEPITGIPVMLARTRKQQLDYSLTKGPGNAARALGISKDQSGINLLSDEIFIADDQFTILNNAIGKSKRIGIENTADAVLKPYRFYLKGNKYVSGYPNK